MREDTLNLTLPKGSVERWTALQARRGKLDETIEIERASLKKALRSTIERALSEVGLTLDEVFSQDKGAVTRMKGKSLPNRRRQNGEVNSKASIKASRFVNPIKYRHPDDARKVWTGRGAQPRWMKDLLASGASLTSLAVSPAGE